LLEQSAGSALAEAHAAGLGVIIKEGLANGRLTERNNEPAFAEKRKVLSECATRLGVTLDALALGAVLAQPWTDCVLSGAANAAQLRSNLTADRVVWDRQLDGLLPDLAEPAEEYWTTRGQLPWN
jgi:aryl-alcohol dehydrogenase-like predicted oxidoreductase